MDTPPKSDTQLAIELLQTYHYTDGDHHKAWIADQALRVLMGERYAEWRRLEEAAGADPKNIDGRAP